MRHLAVALFVLAFLDALSTYVVVATGRGVEANPAVAAIINSNPAAVFPLALASAAVPVASMYVADVLSHMLPTRLRTVAIRLLSSTFYAAVMWRAAVVMNNLVIVLKATLF